MKRRILFLCILVTVLLFSACESKQEILEKNQYRIYYMNKDGDELLNDVYTAKTESGKPLGVISELLLELGKSREGAKAKPAIDSFCKVMNYEVEQKQLLLNFDAGYLSMDSIEEVMHRAAIVKTLSQVVGIDGIEFHVDGQPLSIDRKTVGLMKGEDFINHVGGDGAERTTVVSMYFANKEGDKLVEVPVTITYDTTIPMSRLMIEELLKGPEEIDDAGVSELRRTLPQEAVLNSLTIRDNICYVDFSREFTNLLSNVKSDITIYSVVNLLAELPNVNKVQFTVEGEFIDSYGETKSMNLPFERNLDLVEGGDK